MTQDGAVVQFFGGPEHQPFTLGDGAPGALLIHGFMGTPAEMRPLGEALAAAGYTTRAILLPGFGPDVPNLGQTTKADWLRAASAAWEGLRAAHSRVALIGFSMGAAIALHLAATQPPDALVLIAPFWRFGGWQGQAVAVARHFVRSITPFEKADFANPAVRKQLAAIAPDLDLDDPATQQFLREQVRLPTSVLDDVRTLGRDAHKIAPRIMAPTLVVQGESDDTVTPEATRDLVERLGSRPRYLEAPGTHQLIHLHGRGGALARDAMLDFLALERPSAAS